MVQNNLFFFQDPVLEREYPLVLVEYGLRRLVSQILNEITEEQISELFRSVRAWSSSTELPEQFYKLFSKRVGLTFSIQTEGARNVIKTVHFVLRNLVEAEAGPRYLTWNLPQVLEDLGFVEDGGLAKIEFFLSRPELAAFVAWLSAIREDLLLDQGDVTEEEIQAAGGNPDA